MTESDWERMNDARRREARDFAIHAVPAAPGCYAWYRAGEAVYVGRAINLRARLRRHLMRGLDLSRSAFRRNVAAHIGVASVAECRIRPTILTSEVVGKVNDWVATCEIAWLPADTLEDAMKLEASLLSEQKPALNKAG